VKCPCRIRIFENELRGVVFVSIGFVLGGRVVLESVTCMWKLSGKARDM